MACQTKFTKFLVKISLTQFYSVEKGRQPWNWDVYISSTTNIVLNSDLLFQERSILVHVVHLKQNMHNQKGQDLIDKICHSIFYYLVKFAVLGGRI